MSDRSNAPKRGNRSFVRRTGRITPSQQHGLENLWPRFGIDHDDTPIETLALFGRCAPLIIEIGFGDGGALLHCAQQRPDIDFIGIEVHKPGVGRLLNQLDAKEISNVRVCCDDAVEVLNQRIANTSLAAVHLFFPDPWPKKRHHKRRIVQTNFINLIADKLVPDGLFYMATDWADYAEQMETLVGNNTRFSHILNPSPALSCYIERPSTKFEKRGGKLNHDIWDFVFQKRAS